MVLLESSDHIVSYSVNAEYSDELDDVNCGADSHSHWLTGPSGTSIFTFDIHYHAEGKDSGVSFIDYRGRMQLTAIIENEKQDALQILMLIKQSHDRMNEYIKNNCLAYCSKLRLFDYEITDYQMSRMEHSMLQLKEMLLHENKTGFQKRIEDEMTSLRLDIKVVK